MPDTAFLYFSFIAGLAAFFAPCSFALLPGYISYYISKYSNRDRKNSFFRNVLDGMLFGIIASTGFFTIFGLAGAAVMLLGQYVKQIIPWIAVITGIILIVLGIAMFFSEFAFFQMPTINIARQNKKLGVYLFGIAYAIGSLGCVFPIFLSVVIQGLSYNSFLNGAYTILAYIVGMSLLMIGVTAFAFAAKHVILSKLEKILPYFRKISCAILIAAGIYMIYYQYVLIR